MSIRKYLESAPLSELVRYTNDKDYKKHGEIFSGAHRRHPYDPEKIIIIKEPFNVTTTFYEFKLSDILHVEDLPSIVTESGESIQTVKIWVRKGSVGLKFQAFEVGKQENTSEIWKKSLGY